MLQNGDDEEVLFKMYGFFGRLLRIDLASKSSRVEEIEKTVLKTYLGGKGLGTYLLLREVGSRTEPLSPQNKLIFVTGPAADSGHPAASRYAVLSRSPLTGIYGAAYSGGHAAPVMKRTGFDAFIIEGSSSEPVFLNVSEKGAQFHDASVLWGMDSYETEERIKEQVGVQGSQALVIGPAGENMVRFACIKNNRWRSAGRTGMGAVMGSKKLKGIVFSGRERAAVADECKLKEIVRELRERGKVDGGARAYYNFGTPMMVAIMNEVCSFPRRYWHEGKAPSTKKFSAEYMREQMKTRPRACRGCFIACGKLSTVTGGRHRGLVIEGPEYETIYSFAGLCCIEDLEEVAYLNDLCDRLGMDTISAGNLAALAVEAGLAGKVSGAPRYGDVDGIAALLQEMAEWKGLGSVLARGIREAAAQLGMEESAIHVKGLEPAGYDPRVLKGMGLAYATSDRGACHLRATFYKPELSGIIDPKQVEGKAALFVDYEDRMAVFDTMIFCRFFRDLIGWEELGETIAAVTGIPYSNRELRQLANRVVTLTRMFNISCGLTRADDTLPKRFFREPLGEKGEHYITPEELEQMVEEYYALRGWDSEGVPGGMQQRPGSGAV